MIESIEFTIPMCVVPKQADRSRIVHPDARNEFIRHYQPRKVKENARDLATFCLRHVPSESWTGPVWLSVSFRYLWLKTHTKKERAGSFLKTTPPDVGNMLKQLEDVLEACRFVVNDAQFQYKCIDKSYTGKAETWVLLQRASDE